jgi:GntR family transcriptional regulator
MTLNKNHPIPLYYQLAEQLREEIRSGRLQPGAQLPSERELAEKAGISRMTARQALTYLVRSGELYVKPGLGTYVAEPKLLHNTLHLLSITEEMMRHGEAASSRVLEMPVVTPPAYIASALKLAAGDATVKVVRLRLSGQIPLLMETSYMPQKLCPDLEAEDLGKNSLYWILEHRYGLVPTRTRQTLEATIANDYEARTFVIPAGTPMILLEGITYVVGDQPVEYFKAIYRGDRFKFELESQRSDPTSPVHIEPRVSVLWEQ